MCMCMHVCVCIACMCIYVSGCMCMYVYVSTCTCVCMGMYVYVSECYTLHIHIHTHCHIHTHTDIHTHTYQILIYLFWLAEFLPILRFNKASCLSEADTHIHLDFKFTYRHILIGRFTDGKRKTKTCANDQKTTKTLSLKAINQELCVHLCENTQKQDHD